VTEAERHAVGIETVGDAVRRRRRMRGLTQVEAARELSVLQQTVARWEGGRATPQRRHWDDLARFLGVSVEEIGRVAGAQHTSRLRVVGDDYRAVDGLEERADNDDRAALRDQFARAVVEILRKDQTVDWGVLRGVGREIGLDMRPDDMPRR
jgi:transcriptional regulator with XRE-family HTH domain